MLIDREHRRFGVDPGAPVTDPGRSMLTPIQDAYRDISEVPGWVEDFQAFMFSGYTAAEVRTSYATLYVAPVWLYVPWLIFWIAVKSPTGVRP